MFRLLGAIFRLFIFENLWTKVDLKLLFRIASIWGNFVSFIEYPFHFNRKFYNWTLKSVCKFCFICAMKPQLSVCSRHMSAAVSAVQSSSVVTELQLVQSRAILW